MPGSFRARSSVGGIAAEIPDYGMEERSRSRSFPRPFRPERKR